MNAHTIIAQLSSGTRREPSPTGRRCLVYVLAVGLLVGTLLAGCSAGAPLPVLRSASKPDVGSASNALLVANSSQPVLQQDLKAQQLQIIKAIYPDYQGPDDVCQWTEEVTTPPRSPHRRIECNEAGYLVHLDLSGANLKSLPPEIGQLTSLSELYLGNNRLTSVPPELGQLGSLLFLDLSNNRLISLPPEFGQLASLYWVELSNNRLMSLPRQIGQLTDLQILGLGGNRLTRLPSEFSQLGSLHALDLRNNRLTSLPLGFGQFPNLVWLYLSNNRLTRLPPELGQLDRLYWLDLSNNRLTSLPPELGQLSKLNQLDLSNNWLRSLPPAIGQLASLGTLDLSKNRLTGLPPEIGQVANLVTLDLSNNRLTSLPPEIGQLVDLLVLDLSNNPLTSLPPEVCAALQPVITPTTLCPQHAGTSEPFEGRWTAALTLEKNTRLQTTNTPWFTFTFELNQQGNTVVGTIHGEDIEVSGTLQGTVDSAGVFHGTMRLDWDDHDWDSLTLSLFPDGASGTGTAVFRAAPDELHYYSIYLLAAP